MAVAQPGAGPLHSSSISALREGRDLEECVGDTAHRGRDDYDVPIWPVGDDTNRVPNGFRIREGSAAELVDLGFQHKRTPMLGIAMRDRRVASRLVLREIVLQLPRRHLR